MIVAISTPINEDLLSLNGGYLFTQIRDRVATYKRRNPQARVLSLGIGDVTLPLSPVVTEAMHRVAAEMGTTSGFHGYGPENGYLFLRQAIADSYRRFGVVVQTDDVFVSCGAKNDMADLLELFGDCVVYLPDPGYPATLDSCQIAGRKVRFLKGNEENGFLPLPPENIERGALIILCSPNNPTGAGYTRAALAAWVNAVQESGSVLLYDAAYVAYLGENGIYPHSIYEIHGAECCSIEVCSLSKSAGFTGMRCGWSILPAALATSGISFRRMWARRQATKTNGVAYVVQRAAEAALSPAGLAASGENVRYYLENAALLSETLASSGISHYGGKNAPYLWFRCPGGQDSWAFFEDLLDRAGLVGTPGIGFGTGGENCFRLSAFLSREDAVEAATRLSAFF